jgi:hypothetical protein
MMNSWADILGDISAAEAYRLYLADLPRTNENPGQWLERKSIEQGGETGEEVDANWEALGNQLVQDGEDEIAKSTG